MNLPNFPPIPNVDLPPAFVIPLEAFATFWAVANIVMGFMYLLCGLKIFQVMATITACLWGAALGLYLAHLIDSAPVAMIFCAACLGMATWFYTRWMVALPMGLGAAALAWITSQLNGANPLAAFFISLAAAVAFGAPVLIFYRTIVMALTCLQGAILVVVGTAVGILIIRHRPVNLLQTELQSGGHMILAGVCVLLLALPGFYFQRLRYEGSSEMGEDSGESSSAKEYAPRKKAA